MHQLLLTLADGIVDILHNSSFVYICTISFVLERTTFVLIPGRMYRAVCLPDKAVSVVPMQDSPLPL